MGHSENDHFRQISDLLITCTVLHLDRQLTRLLVSPREDPLFHEGLETSWRSCPLPSASAQAPPTSSHGHLVRASDKMLPFITCDVAWKTQNPLSPLPKPRKDHGSVSRKGRDNRRASPKGMALSGCQVY